MPRKLRIQSERPVSPTFAVSSDHDFPFNVLCMQNNTTKGSFFRSQGVQSFNAVSKIREEHRKWFVSIANIVHKLNSCF